MAWSKSGDSEHVCGLRVEQPERGACMQNDRCMPQYIMPWLEHIIYSLFVCLSPGMQRTRKCTSLPVTSITSVNGKPFCFQFEGHIESKEASEEDNKR